MVKQALWVDHGEGPVQNPALTQEEFEAGIAQAKADNIAALWEAAHQWEYADINGGGIGMLTLGVIQGKPKALAAQAWIQSIWALYYQRKPLVTHVVDPSLLDFSSVGRCPHTIPELLAELGMA